MKQMLEEYKPEKERRDRVSKDVGHGPSFDEHDEDEMMERKRKEGNYIKKNGGSI